MVDLLVVVEAVEVCMGNKFPIERKVVPPHFILLLITLIKCFKFSQQFFWFVIIFNNLYVCSLSPFYMKYNWINYILIQLIIILTYLCWITWLFDVWIHILSIYIYIILHIFSIFLFWSYVWVFKLILSAFHIYLS